MPRRGVTAVATLAAVAWAAFSLAPRDTAAGGAEAPASWAFAIGNGHLKGSTEEVGDRLGAFDLVVVDGEEANRAEVGELQGRGATVLAYLSVGTIEKWRSWFRSVKRYRLKAGQDWKDEWFADVSKRKLRRKITRRIAPKILAKGFDGLFLDNVDMVEARAHRDQRRGMRRLVRKLSRLVHDQGLLLFTQNGHPILLRLGLVERIDGWNREDVTWTYDFDRRRYERQREGKIATAQGELRDFVARGLVVTAADYTKAGDEGALAEAVAKACEAGALPYVSDIGLSVKRLPDAPLECG